MRPESRADQSGIQSGAGRGQERRTRAEYRAERDADKRDTQALDQSGTDRSVTDRSGTDRSDTDRSDTERSAETGGAERTVAAGVRAERGVPKKEIACTRGRQGQSGLGRRAVCIGGGGAGNSRGRCLAVQRARVVRGARCAAGIRGRCGRSTRAGAASGAKQHKGRASDDGRVAGWAAQARVGAVMHGTIARGEPHCEDGPARISYDLSQYALAKSNSDRTPTQVAPTCTTGLPDESHISQPPASCS